MQAPQYAIYLEVSLLLAVILMIFYKGNGKSKRLSPEVSYYIKINVDEPDTNEGHSKHAHLIIIKYLFNTCYALIVKLKISLSV